MRSFHPNLFSMDSYFKRNFWKAAQGNHRFVCLEFSRLPGYADISDPTGSQDVPAARPDNFNG
jgi:hypothetical protein